MTLENQISIPVIKELKDRLASVSLMFLGQHLWELQLANQLSRHPQDTVLPSGICLCKCCTEARQAYQMATGFCPTSTQEKEAMVARSRGEGRK